MSGFADPIPIMRMMRSMANCCFLASWDGRLELTHKPILGFVGTWGLQYTSGTFSGINVNNQHKPFPDEAYGFDGNPDYLTENVSMFFTERRSFGALDIEATVRKDWRRIKVGVPKWRSTVGPELAGLFAEWYGADWKQFLESEDVARFRMN